MTAPTVAYCGIVPVARHADANRLAWALNYQPEGANTFSIKLTPNGSTQTHAAFVQSASDGFVSLLVGGRAGTLPSVRWEDYGLTARKTSAVLAELAVYVVPLRDLIGAGQWLGDHLAAACRVHDPPLAVLEVVE